MSSPIAAIAIPADVPTETQVVVETTEVAPETTAVVDTQTVEVISADVTPVESVGAVADAPAVDTTADDTPVPTEALAVEVRAAESGAVADAPAIETPVEKVSEATADGPAALTKPKLIEYLSKYPLAQQRTGKNKQFVMMVGDTIMKGPYTAEKLQKIDLRSRILHILQVKMILHPNRSSDGSLVFKEVELIDGSSGYFLSYPNLATEYQQEYQAHEESFGDHLKYNIIKKRVGLVKASDALKDGQKWIASIENVTYLMAAYMMLYGLGVGDTGLFNCLADEKKQQLYIIDYDEDRSGSGEGEFFFFSRAPAQQIVNLWKPMADAAYPSVIQYASEIYQNPQVQQALNQFGVWPSFQANLYAAIMALTQLHQYNQQKMQDVAQTPTSAAANAVPYAAAPTAAVNQTQMYPGMAVAGQPQHTQMYGMGMAPQQQVTVQQILGNYKKMKVDEMKAGLARCGVPEAVWGGKGPNKAKKDDLKEMCMKVLHGHMPTAPNVQKAEATAHPTRGPLGKMSWKTQFNAITFSGHSLDVMKSALQKYVRKGETV